MPTHTNPLSKREVELLKGNTNIESITPHTVKFTESFKELVYENKRNGISVRETMRQSGIDPDIIGESRIRGLSHTLNKQASREGRYSDQRQNNYRRPKKTGEETLEQRIKELENELAYTRQEVEFLKKLQVANTEAQKQWESKHRQK